MTKVNRGRRPPVFHGRYGAALRVPGRLAWLSALTLLTTVALMIVRPLGGRRAAAALLRWSFETGGGLLVKLGQFLATRYDVLAPEYCDEFARLLDHTRPIATALVIRE